MSSEISLWSCAARCADLVDREVVGLYRGEKPLLVSRPWCAPSSVPILQVTVRRLYPLLSSLISVADYHAVDGTWYGEIATGWHAVAAIGGMSRNTIGTSLQELMREGFIHYSPAWGRANPALIRVFPYNSKTGRRVFQINETWLRPFILQVEPRVKVYEAATESKSVEFKTVAPDVPMSEMGMRISQAPVFVQKKALNEPSVRAREEWQEKGDYFLAKLKDVAGLEAYHKLAAGLNPLPDNPSLPPSPEAGLDKGGPQSSWKSDSWSQGGFEIKVVGEEALPAPADLGVLPSWAVSADAADAEAGTGAPRDVRSHRAQPQGSTSKQLYSLERPNDYSDVVVGVSSPTAGLNTPVAAANSAPPAAAPPSASEHYLRPSSQRQLLPGQVAALYELRGKRVNDATRRALTTKQVSCIETYERMIGAPFCERDMPFLERALTLTSHTLVLRAIRDCSRYPDENPGFYTVRDGMKQVLTYIESNRMMHSQPRTSKDRKDRISSGMDADLAKKLRDRRRRRAGSSATPIVSPAAPPVPSVAGIVSEKTDGVPSQSAEPRGKA